MAVIGGGAAGLMAAVSALEADPHLRVVLIERNRELGKKIKISGGGRCNVTTGITDIKTVLTKYPRGGKFLISSIHAFPPLSMKEWVESQGVPLKTEEDLRVFPCSDRGEDIVGMFERLLNESGAKIYSEASVTSIQKRDGIFHISIKEWTFEIKASSLVIATGGQAYRQTGSTGDGYAFAESFGHSITSLAPSLSSYFTAESWPAELAGVSFSHARLFTRSPKAEFEGGFVFTHKGISGPAVFALSAQLAFEKTDASQPLNLHIDFFPLENAEALLDRINRLIADYPKKELLTVLSFMIPKSVAEVLLREAGILAQSRAAECSKKDRSTLVSWLKGMPLHVVGRGAGEEFVTAGGINTKEIDPKTMESKIVPDLYLVGEVLDVDGYTGGFNLQASWATGRAAGLAVGSRKL